MQGRLPGLLAPCTWDAPLLCLPAPLSSAFPGPPADPQTHAHTRTHLLSQRVHAHTRTQAVGVGWSGSGDTSDRLHLLVKCSGQVTVRNITLLFFGFFLRKILHLLAQPGLQSKQESSVHASGAEKVRFLPQHGWKFCLTIPSLYWLKIRSQRLCPENTHVWTIFGHISPPPRLSQSDLPCGGERVSHSSLSLAESCLPLASVLRAVVSFAQPGLVSVSGQWHPLCRAAAETAPRPPLQRPLPTPVTSRPNKSPWENVLRKPSPGSQLEKHLLLLVFCLLFSC